MRKQYGAVHPMDVDAETVADLQKACGQLDANPDALLALWATLDVEQCSWLVLDEKYDYVGYGVVTERDDKFIVELCAPPTEEATVAEILLFVAERYIGQQIEARALSGAVAEVCLLSERDVAVAVEAGFVREDGDVFEKRY